MKVQLAQKKKKLKKMKQLKKKKEKEEKEAEEKREKENKNIEHVELSAELEGVSNKKGEAPIPMDSSAMNAYSLAVAHVAENSEPDMPTNYGTETEK